MNIFLYAILWLSFGLGHSISAKLSVQQRFAPSFQYYRLCYNAFAAVHILLVLYLGLTLLSTETFTFFTSLLAVMKFIQLAGLIFILLALRQYDLKEFLGIAVLLNRKARNESGLGGEATKLEPLNTGGLNQWVRHPLYVGGFIFLWGGAVSPFGFYTALFGSLYLLIGSWHEEKKLVRLYADEYRRYQQRVPRFIPKL